MWFVPHMIYNPTPVLHGNTISLPMHESEIDVSSNRFVSLDTATGHNDPHRTQRFIHNVPTCFFADELWVTFHLQ